MLEVTPDNAATYLRAEQRAAPTELLAVRELTGGVSNVVLLVEVPQRGERFVLKQARRQLRVPEEWLCPVERIWREVEVLRICGELLRTGNVHFSDLSETPLEVAVPQLLWEDRDNYVYAMTAAPPGNRTWKEILLAGEVSQSIGIARACGKLLAELHAASWHDEAIAERLSDRTYFEQLRLDPYYRQVARVHPDLRPELEGLIDSVWQHRRCLVHGDFSPKNLLVSPGEVLLIDFEVGHFGDPAFDLGFFLTHLVLKCIWAGERHDEYLRLITQFWEAYRTRLELRVASAEVADLQKRMLLNLAGCLLARVDGKSRVEYLSPPAQDKVRGIARRWLVKPPQTLQAAVELAIAEY
jgi:5-methylthioribose kinase